MPATTAQRPDVKIWWGRAERHVHQVTPGRSSYVAVLDGEIRIEGTALESGDRAVLDGGRWAMEGDAELLVLDLSG